MNLDEIQQLWNASANAPTEEQRVTLVKQFNSDRARRRQKELAWLIWTFCVLAVLTGFVAWLLVGTSKVDPAREWGAIPLLLIPWVLAVLFLKRFLRGRTPANRGDISVAECLAATLAANQAERLKSKMIGIMYIIAIPVLSICLWQLYSVGKVSSREMISMVTFLGGALALSGSAVLAHYRLRLLPTTKRLEALLGQLQDAAS